MTPMLSIRPATIEDAPQLAAMIRELAEFEHLDHEMNTTAEDLVRDGFGEQPKFRAVLALWDGEPVGYAVFFEFYSSFQGRAGLFLDDLFVRPSFRKRGIGKSLLAHVAGIAFKEKYVVSRGMEAGGSDRRCARGGSQGSRVSPFVSPRTPQISSLSPSHAIFPLLKRLHW
jgi:GNAT superfamily N-acetyltransferase